jgi:hypothetical protein
MKLKPFCSLVVLGSSLPSVVCRRVHVLFRMFGSSLPSVVCRRSHVLFTTFASSLPSVVCRRVHVLFTLCSVRLGKDEPNILNKT